jgi:hypothetical protein
MKITGLEFAIIILSDSKYSIIPVRIVVAKGGDFVSLNVNARRNAK